MRDDVENLKWASLIFQNKGRSILYVSFSDIFLKLEDCFNILDTAVTDLLFNKAITSSLGREAGNEGDIIKLGFPNNDKTK